MQTPTTASPRGTTLQVLGDAAFVACSWTWCIGMFLPVLLLRDMGPWSFVAFAVPNCIGAALLAWWMKGSAGSGRFVHTHRSAMVAFSAVTIAFQSFFVAWFAMRLGLTDPGLGVMVALLAGALLFPGNLFDDGPRRAFSLAVLGASVLLLATSAWQDNPVQAWTQLPAPERPAAHVWPLLAVCMLGFGCSPLLDGTFHAALQRSASGTGKPEFALGFLLLFPLMILGTLAYGAVLLVLAATQGLSVVPANLTTVVMVHIALQAGFTLAAHGAWARHPAGGAARLDISLGAVIVGVLLAMFGRVLVGGVGVDSASLGMVPHEVLYRAFLAFYGLVVPLYVLGCCLGSLGVFPHAPGPSLPRIAVLVAGGAIAATFYTRGFMLRDTPQLWAGAAIVLGAGLAARWLPGPKGKGQGVA